MQHHMKTAVVWSVAYKWTVIHILNGSEECLKDLGEVASRPFLKCDCLAAIIQDTCVMC